MAETTITYKCPNCDAGLIFDAEKQLFACEFCLSEFGEDDLKGTSSQEKAEKAERENSEFREEINEYHCQSCGAQIIADKSTVADFCYYCHNPVVLVDRVTGSLKPVKIIPFAFDKAAAKEAFLRFAKKKRFLPRDYFSLDTAEKISGVYFPFWVTDADTLAHLDTVAHRVAKWRSGSYRYTEISNYSVKRSGYIHFEDITTSAYSEEDKRMLEGILPYPMEAYRDFSMPYLLGYVAKKKDMEREAVQGEVRERMKSYATTLLKRTVNGYGKVDTPSVCVNINSCHWDYSLLPVWILTYRKKGRKKDKVYTYAMNGSTGKVYGELPVSIPKILATAGAIVTALTTVFTLIGRFLI